MSIRVVLAVLAGMALLALVFSTAAHAQQSGTEDQKAQEQQTQEQQTQEQQAEQKQADEQMQSTQSSAQTASAPAEEEAAPTPLEGQFVEQPDETYATSELIGHSVYSADDEDIGQISDLLVTESNRIVGVVIGVGGFLGIGEKPIAVQLDLLKRTSVPGGEEQLVLDFTRQELEQAPRFVSLAEQKRLQEEAEKAREQEQQQQMQQQGSGEATSG